MSISSIPVPLCIFRGLCFPVKSKHLLWVKGELQRQKLVHCNAKKQGTRRQLACWSGFSSRNATAFYDHLRLSVVSLFFNPQSVNTNHRILPQMIRVEMKHPSGPAVSTAGHLAGPVPCLPWHENFRLARQAGSAPVPCGGRSDKPLRAVSQQRDWLHPVPTCQPPGCHRGHGGQPVRGPSAPSQPRCSGAPRPAGAATGQPLSVRGSAPWQEFPAVWEPDSECLSTLLPKRRCRKDDFPLRSGTQTGRLLLFS